MRNYRPIAALLLATCVLTLTVAAQAQPVVQKPVWPPIGATWTYQETSTGVLGSGTRSKTFRRIPDEKLEGTAWIATAQDNDVFLYNNKAAAIAIVRNGTVFLRYEQPARNFPWPLQVGARWSMDTRFKVSVSPDMQTGHMDGVVEAYESVTTPAGTFDCFRIHVTTGETNHTRWWTPTLGVNVRSVTDVRGANQATGHQEMVLTSFKAR